eukprot:GHUV01024680.1.p1 GENE.GHUV01024680.1~~GHUV01024680.1.p1  ORF type:complete len:303 (-),score=64.17 GHUV01024680.1:4-912(-)
MKLLDVARRRHLHVPLGAVVVLLALVFVIVLWQGCDDSTRTLKLSYKPADFTQQRRRSVRLFIGVVSGCGNIARRMAIRRTWGLDARLERVVFVLANPGNTSLLDSVVQGALNYRDIVLVNHVQEHYFNITYQTLEIYRSAFTFGKQLTHVMKCDDDSFVNITRLLEAVEAQPKVFTLLGNLDQSYIPHRDKNSKWYIPKEEFPDDRVNVSFAYGAGYVLTADLAFAIAAGGVIQCMPDRLFKLEDVATGLLADCIAKRNGWQLHAVTDGRFSNLGCSPDSIVSHYRTPTQMDCMFAKGVCC